VLELIKKIRGGKAISVDCIPDTFVSTPYLKKLLIIDDKVTEIAEKLESDGGY
jgi:hypothetical protein